MKNLEPYVINGGKTTPYFELERGNRKRRPNFGISLYYSFGSNFFLIKANPDIEGLQSFSQTFLYSAYADDNTFFSKINN